MSAPLAAAVAVAARSGLGGYAVAFAATLLIAVAEYGVKSERSFPLGFEPFLIPIALGAVVGGLGPGLLAVAISAIAGAVLTWSGSIHAWNGWEWFGLLVAGAMMVVLLDRLRRSSRALAVSECRCSAILESASDGIVTVDERQSITSFNASAERIFGWRAAEIIGRPLEVLLPASARPSHAEMVRSFGRAPIGSARTMGTVREVYGRRRDGSEFPMEASISKVEVNGETVLTAIVRDLTERRRAEAELRDREFKLRLFLHNAPASMAMYDRDLRVLLSTGQWARDMGVGSGQAAVEGRLLSELLPNMPPRWQAIHQRCLAGAVERGEDERVVHPDGTSDWFSWEIRPWHAASGEVGGLVTVGWAVTDRKRALDALRDSEERWRRLVETLPEALFVHEDDRVVYVNQPAIDLWRAKSALDIVGRSATELIHPEHRHLIELLIADRTTPEKVVPLWESRIVALDGTIIPIETTARVRMIDGHQIAQVIVRDISERKAVEDKLRLREALLRDMGRMAHVGGWTADAEGGRQYWTEEVPRLFDVDPAAPMTMEDRLAMFDGAAKEKIAAAIRGTLSHGLSYDVEVDLVTRAGNHKWIRSIGQPVVEDGAVVGIRAACQDVTAQHEASESIRRMNDELEARVDERTSELAAANDELEAFSYSVSHDLRAPLRTMDGYAEIVQSDFGDQLPEEARRCVRVIREGAQRMGALIDDLLAFSRLGREKLRPADVDMRALAEETIAELRPSCGPRNVEIDVESLCPCRGDRALLKQVWTNLIANALKYTRPRHTARIAIGCTRDPASDVPTYFVRDNGVGFDMRYADKLFGVFQRLHRVKDFEGTGVGLAIVQRIVGRHGGRVWCDAEEGQGATFFFTVAPEAPPAIANDGHDVQRAASAVPAVVGAA